MIGYPNLWQMVSAVAAIASLAVMTYRMLHRIRVNDLHHLQEGIDRIEKLIIDHLVWHSKESDK